MQEEDKNKDVVEEITPEDEDDLAFIQSLLNPEDEETVKKTAEEEALAKKNAEEAQKRRDREAKEKADKEAKELEEKAKAEALAAEEAEKARLAAEEAAKQKAEAEAKANKEKTDAKENEVTKLAKQIADFKIKFPEVDIQKLQQDKDFTEYLNGKLLGKKSFTELFEGYSEFVKRITGENQTQKYHKNAEKPSSSSALKGTGAPEDVYSEEEMNRLSERMPFMSRQELARINEKVKRSINYYNKK